MIASSVAAVLMIALACAGVGAAQPAADVEPGVSQPDLERPRSKPALAAVRALGPLVVDGHLHEADWERAPRADAFVQIEPQEGRPATERTVVRVLFDDTHLYFGVECFDSAGATDLRVRDLRRDFDDTTDDFFGVSIDGVRDEGSALVFRVNPLGALRDQQTVDGGLADLDFDAVWTARAGRGGSREREGDRPLFPTGENGHWRMPSRISGAMSLRSILPCPCSVN
jgi:hypothetical protein